MPKDLEISGASLTYWVARAMFKRGTLESTDNRVAYFRDKARLPMSAPKKFKHELRDLQSTVLTIYHDHSKAARASSSYVKYVNTRSIVFAKVST